MIRSAIKIFLIAILLIVSNPIIWLLNKFSDIRWRDAFVRFAHRSILHICEIRLDVVSEPADNRPLLIVSNHLSYLDIPLLGSQVSVCFTPKADIAGWPVIGSICKNIGCVFIERSASKVSETKSDLIKAISEGNLVSLYPEATTGKGAEVLPFRSGLFSLAEEDFGNPLFIQPVAITYRSIRKLPIDNTQWPHIAWYGDMEFLPHLWNFLKFGPIDVELAFLEPIKAADYNDRKTLAVECRKMIAEHIESVRSERRVAGQAKKFSPFGAWSKSK